MRKKSVECRKILEIALLIDNKFGMGCSYNFRKIDYPDRFQNTATDGMFHWIEVKRNCVYGGLGLGGIGTDN